MSYALRNSLVYARAETRLPATASLTGFCSLVDCGVTMAAPVMVIGLSALIILALGVAAQSASSVTVTLNSTAPSREVQIPGTSSDTFAITLNICSGTSLPVIRVSTASPPDYTIDRSTADRSSGGSLASPNRVSRDQPTWDLSWDLGYANWTGEADSLGILISLDDSGGSAVVRIDVGSTCEYSTVYLG
jgi:hypothetical protein